MFSINPKLIFIIFDLHRRVLSKKPLPTPRSQELSTVFSQSFILSEFRYWSMPHLELICCIHHVTGVSCGYPMVLAPFVEKFFFSPIEIWYIFQNSTDHISLVYYGYPQILSSLINSSNFKNRFFGIFFLRDQSPVNTHGFISSLPICMSFIPFLLPLKIPQNAE